MADNAAPAPEAPTTPAPTEANTAAAPAAPEVDPFDALLKSKPLTFKSNGKDVSVSDRATLTRRLQQMDGIEKARGEAIENRTKAEQLQAELDSLKGDPLAAITKLLGGDEAQARELIEAKLWERIQKEEAQKAMDPAQRRAAAEREKEQAELAALKREKTERAEKERQVQDQQQYEQVRDVVSSAILESLKEIQAPPEMSADMVPLVARRLQASLDAGLTMEAAMADAIRDGRAAMERPLRALLKGGPKALEWLGEDGKAFIQALRKHDIESWRASGGKSTPASSPTEERKTEHPRGRMGEVEDELRKLQRGG